MSGGYVFCVCVCVRNPVIPCCYKRWTWLLLYANSLLYMYFIYLYLFDMQPYVFPLFCKTRKLRKTSSYKKLIWCLKIYFK